MYSLHPSSCPPFAFTISSNCQLCGTLLAKPDARPLLPIPSVLGYLLIALASRHAPGRVAALCKDTRSRSNCVQSGRQNSSGRASATNQFGHRTLRAILGLNRRTSPYDVVVAVG